MVMVSTIVDTHGHGLYHCGYSWSWSLLLWILMVIAAIIVDTHGHGRSIVDTHGHGL